MGVEFMEALDGTSDTLQHYEHNLQMNEQQNEDVIDDKVEKGQYRFYKLLFDASMSNIKISVTPQNKEYDVDLYVSWTCFEPGSDANNYDYHCVETGAAQIIINNNEENNHLYIGVHGFDNNEKEQKEKEEEENEILFTLNVTNISLNDLEIANLHRASSLTTHDNDNDET